MAKQWSRAEIEASLRDANTWRLGDAVRMAPVDVDPRVIADAALRLLSQHLWRFARSCRRLPDAAIAMVLEALTHSERTPERVLLCTYMEQTGGGDVGKAWGEALQVLLDLNTSYGRNSAKHREKMERLAAHPHALAAIQAACAGCAPVPVDMLRVLLIDGSDASHDALMPSFEHALLQGGRSLEQLATLDGYVEPTPIVSALMKRVKGHLELLNAGSPALEWARAQFGSSLDAFWLDLWLTSESRPGSGARYTVHVSVDSRRMPYFWANVGELHVPWKERHTTFDVGQPQSVDDLGLGRCELPQLPEFIARAEAALKITWEWAGTPRTNLRGRRRDALIKWLKSGTASRPLCETA